METHKEKAKNKKKHFCSFTLKFRMGTKYCTNLQEMFMELIINGFSKALIVVLLAF